MKLKKLMFPTALAIICLPGIVQAQQMIVQAGNMTIIRDENGSIEVDTGNTRMRSPQQLIDNDYSINDAEINSSNPRQINLNSNCGTRSVQSTQQSNHNGSKQTVTQTNISTNICQ